MAWFIAELCGRAGISKTILAEKFASRIGMSPIEYLRVWRMHIAARWLKEIGSSQQTHFRFAPENFANIGELDVTTETRHQTSACPSR